VTIGLWAGGRVPAADILPYVVAQVIGAIVAGVLYVIANGSPTFDPASGFASNGYGGQLPGRLFARFGAADRDRADRVLPHRDPRRD
jgi:aquaporin Z